MGEQYHQIFKSFIKEHLGGLAGNMLLSMYLKEIGAGSLNDLDEKEVIRFSDYFLYQVFRNHMEREEIDSIRVQLNLQFCFDMAGEKIKKMLGQDIRLKPFRLKIEDKGSFDVILNSLSKDITAITIDVFGYVNGQFIFFIFRDSAIDLANMMIKSQLGQESPSRELDPIKESAIKEFMNIILPTFVGTVSNILEKDIRYRIVEHGLTDVSYQIALALSKTNESKNGTDIVSRILSTEVEIDVSGTKIQGVCYFLLEESGTLSSSINKSGIKMDKVMIDVDLSRIHLSSGTPPKEALIELMNQFFPGEGEEKVELAMAEVNIGGFSRLSPGVKMDFAAVLINRNFREYGEHVIEFIRKAVGDILSVQLGAVNNPKTGLINPDIIGKMLRD